MCKESSEFVQKSIRPHMATHSLTAMHYCLFLNALVAVVIIRRIFSGVPLLVLKVNCWFGIVLYIFMIGTILINRSLLRIFEGLAGDWLVCQLEVWFSGFTDFCIMTISAYYHSAGFYLWSIYKEPNDRYLVASTGENMRLLRICAWYSLVCESQFPSWIGKKMAGMVCALLLPKKLMSGASLRGKLGDNVPKNFIIKIQTFLDCASSSLPQKCDLT